MGIKVLPADLACERAWQTYCQMNPAAKDRKSLRTDLISYLSKLETVDSTALTVNGLKYLKSMERLEGRKFSKGRLASL
jgi:hypothetical protein